MFAKRIIAPGRYITRGTRAVSQALVEPMAWNAPPTTITTLPNGVRVATQETFSEVPSVGVFVDSGYRMEEASGVAHLVEKLMTAGTKKRPADKLLTEVETMGGKLAVTMGREQLALTMSVFKTDVKQAVDILSDIVASPGLENLEKEKPKILQTLDMTEAAAKDVIFDRLHTTAFRDSNLGLSNIGPFDGIDKVTQAHLQAYTSKNFTSDKVVLAASGAVKHADLVKLAEASLGGLKPSSPPTLGEKPYFCGAELNYRNDEMGPTAYLAVGWEGVPLRSADSVVFMVMQAILGSYKKDTGIVPGTISGNRVVNAIANKMGVGCADEYEAINLQYKDTGIFGFYAACDEVAVEHCIGELQFGVNNLSHMVTEEEVERAKRELRTKLASGNGGSAEALQNIGAQVMGYGRVISPAEMTLRINAIDSEEVKRVAWKYLHDAEIAVTALGPTHGLPQYLDLRRATYMHRY